MEPVHEDQGENAVAKAMKATSLAHSVKKRAKKAAKEALEVAHQEMKRKALSTDPYV